MGDACSGMYPCFTGLDALVPRVTKVWIAGTSTTPEPRTAATATTEFAGFADGAAFGTSRTDSRHPCS